MKFNKERVPGRQEHPTTGHSDPSGPNSGWTDRRALRERPSPVRRHK